ncbi:MAG: asparagine synthase-related protein, partial [Bacteroidota bacterium]|nr:asparagine synthase-related protein [Bacteroidota bacterium]
DRFYYKFLVMVHFSPKYNNGFHWFTQNNIRAKGYLFDAEGKYYCDDGLTEYFFDVKDNESLQIKLEQANGLFTAFVQIEDAVYLACDPTRTFPLFYCLKDKEFYVSDSIESLMGITGLKDPDPLSQLEFRSTAFVAGRETLIKGIYQVQAGEMVCLRKYKAEQSFYHTYTTSFTVDSTKEVFTKKFEELLDDVFGRLIASLGGRTIVLPLSGGYDSRLIAVMLKKYDVRNVICFTYGRRDNPEMEISSKTACILGYPWYFVEYTPELIRDFIQDDCFQEYFRYSAQYSSMFYMQEYFAVKYLTEHSLIPKDAVFVPGHSGDFLGGSHLDGKLKPHSSAKKLVNEIFNRNFILSGLSGKEKQMLKAKIWNPVKEEGSEKKLLTYSLYENWDLKERQAKFIINSSNVYYYFGHQVRLPLWDTGLVNFFNILPYELKLYKRFYNRVLEESYFKPFHVHFENEFQPAPLQIKLQVLKNYLRPFIPEWVKEKILLRND